MLVAGDRITILIEEFKSFQVLPEKKVPPCPAKGTGE
jgi:hypothetical protein